MSRKHNGVNWNRSSKARARRSNVVTRLNAQLKYGKKMTKDGLNVVLTEGDISRIEKEILTLKERV